MSGNACNSTSDSGMFPDLKQARRTFSIWTNTASSSTFSGSAIMRRHTFSRCTCLASAGGQTSGSIRTSGGVGGARRPKPPRTEKRQGADAPASLGGDEPPDDAAERKPGEVKLRPGRHDELEP